MRAWAFLVLSGCSEASLAPIEELPALPDAAALRPEAVEERIQPSTASSLDVLWVVDDSRSMEEEQLTLAANAPAFIDRFLEDQALDWHLGITTTDMITEGAQGRMLAFSGRRYLDRDTPEVSTRFEAGLVRGIDGGAPERGLDASWRALTPPLVDTLHDGFLRDDADLHIIVISDQRDYSIDIVPAAYLEFLEELKDGQRATFSGILGTRQTTCDGWVEPGFGYLEVIQATGGLLVDLCTPDWGPVIGDLAQVSLRPEVFLRSVPRLDTLVVVLEAEDFVRELTRGRDYLYDAVRNSLVLFDRDLPYDVVAVVRYVPEEGPPSVEDR